MEPSTSLIELANQMAGRYGTHVQIGLLAFTIAMQSARHDLDRHNNSYDFLERLLNQCSAVSEEDREIIEAKLEECELIFIQT